MPWTQKQHNLFEAAAHNPAFAQKVGIPPQKASQMASEGIKPKMPKIVHRQLLAKGLMK